MFTGPQIQLPDTSKFDPQLAAFLNITQLTMYAMTRSGDTASRPTSSMPGRFIGMPYMDLTLGLPVFLKIASTNVWVKADGTPA